ncbi:hypothetical protein H1D32_22630 [Anaerobacillus sp. CMMVII]|uniref:hypothetical protein n=1 Tax=Anaerobacillus sp. CMMVII TaxID=2755588 RepID=UPI0021B822B7|nr:hypothetical protein [Anaerobacillus sp. CMMVII]MCT8140247.1 hypothetical protein [Anaerobacillus sp. CMMVII]
MEQAITTLVSLKGRLTKEEVVLRYLLLLIGSDLIENYKTFINSRTILRHAICFRI